jgi:hypothetical protein
MRMSLELNVVVPGQLNRMVLPYMGAGSSILYIGSTLSEKAVAGCPPCLTRLRRSLGGADSPHKACGSYEYTGARQLDQFL